ncbi:MAG TPA: hypothetical protein GXX23_01705 [Firmicutes bacterium]|nr:hypothetical protein [Candidatus Fermentithermobacillaceae bacterium]
MRKELPLAITFVVALIALLSGVVQGPIPGLGVSIGDIYGNYIGKWMTVVSAFALCLASVNLILVHGRAVARKRSQDWIYSAILLGTLVVYALFRTYVELNPADEAARANYSLIYDYILSPLMSGQWACLAFYVGSASYRAFRARNLEATVLLVSAIVVMLGAAPIGSLLWDQFPAIQQWLLNVPSMTGQRALLLGAALGSFSTSLRTLLGIERGHLGGM